MRRSSLVAAVALAGSVLLPGCHVPNTVPVFCGAASATLTEAAPVLRDLGGACLRIRMLEADPARFAAITADPACEAVSRQAEGAVAAAALLGRYFDALNALAAPASLKLGTDSAALASEASSAFGGSSSTQTALASIAASLGTAATDHYGQKTAARDLAQVNTNVGAITDGLAFILQTNYIEGELADEDKKLTTHYRDFARDHPGDGSLLLHLDERWQVDHERLEERRASAEALIASLHLIRTAVAQLAASSHPLDPKQASALLTPYTGQIQAAIPRIQKGF